MVFVFFNFSKNIIRLNNVDDIFIGIQKINNKFTLNEKSNNEFLKIYRPDTEANSNNGWQGRLCWNIPFICSYNDLNVDKKNSYLFIIK